MALDPHCGRLIRVGSLALAIIAISMPVFGEEHPWPMWGRTAGRIGRTETVGPKTPTVAWRVQVDFWPEESVELSASPVMGTNGYVYVLVIDSLVAVDTSSREIVWSFPALYGFIGGIALWEDRVLFGTAEDDDNSGNTAYCLDAETGEEVWRETMVGYVDAPVVDSHGIVYFLDSAGVVRARRVEDGSEVWTTGPFDVPFGDPSLDEATGTFQRPIDFDWGALDITNGDSLWTFDNYPEIFGIAPIDNGRVYVGSRNGLLYCLDALTGAEYWRFDCEWLNRGATCIGHDGTIYTNGEKKLFAISPDGEEIWRYSLGNAYIHNAGIVDGDGTVYLGTNKSPKLGTVQAVNPEGTALWIHDMPDYVTASPMLAPDGTLYVLCRDKYLYAFKDPTPGDVDGDGDVDQSDLAALLAAWGTIPGDPFWNPDADFDADGAIGQADLGVLLANYGC
jgi:outer membrane protein assembly factor BamB